jgi:hypothetical protein
MALNKGYQAAHQKRGGVRRGGADALPHNNSLNRSGISLIVIVNLNQFAVDSRPVNSSVRTDRRRCPANMDVSGLRQGRSNMPMHPTGHRLPLIEKLSHDAVVSRRVIGGVMSALRINTQLIPAAPLLCE